ncbi:MAG TPA: hypothetical protein PJ998_03645 [Terrimesophilobacter sp.]|nr:hypothetical protein [Terrimesophilobacter sp.]
MTLFTENTRKLLVPILVLAVLIVSIALFFYASASVAIELPWVGWILLGLVAVGALGLGWLAWERASSASGSKSTVRELPTSAVMMVMLEAITVAVAVLAAFVWLAPVMGLRTVLVVPFALGLVSVVALILDMLSKTGRLAERWRALEAATSVFVVFSVIATLFYLALGA